MMDNVRAYNKIVQIILFILFISCCAASAQHSDISNQSNELLGLHWGDEYTEISKIFANKLRKPSKSEIDKMTGVFSTGKMMDRLSYVVEDVLLFGVSFNIYLYTKTAKEFEGKLDRVVAINDNITHDEFHNMIKIISSVYGKFSFHNKSKSFCFFDIGTEDVYAWRVGKNGSSISYIDCNGKSSVTFSALGEVK